MQERTFDLDSPEIQAGLADRGTRTQLEDGPQVHSYTLDDVLSVATGESRADHERRRTQETEETAEVEAALRRTGAVVEQRDKRWHVRTGPHAGTVFDTARSLPSTPRAPAAKLAPARVLQRPRGAGRPAARRASGPRSGQDPGARRRGRI